MSLYEPLTTVVIPTYNRDDRLLHSIECVLSNTYPNFELLVVDQTEKHPSRVKSAFERYARNDQFQHVELPISNLPLARNVGLRRAKGDIVIYVDDDVELESNFVSAHVRRYRDNSVHAVAGQVRHPGSDSENNDPPPPGRIDGQGRIEGGFWQTRHGGHSVEWGLGCNMSFRKETLVHIGGFDERYTGTAINEEVDAFVRLNNKGYNAVYAPDASLVHHVAPTGGCRDDEAILSGAQSDTKNRCLYATKTLRMTSWLRYIAQEVRSSYSVARIRNLGLAGFAQLVASSMRGILLVYTQSPDRHSTALGIGLPLTAGKGRDDESPNTDS